jgi:hypothetical protein
MEPIAIIAAIALLAIAATRRRDPRRQTDQARRAYARRLAREARADARRLEALRRLSRMRGGRL